MIRPPPINKHQEMAYAWVEASDFIQREGRMAREVISSFYKYIRNISNDILNGV
jgi:hypothetical protein